MPSWWCRSSPKPPKARSTCAVYDLSDGRFVLAFDREERMAAFLDAPAPFAALSGRRLAALLDGRKLGLALNLGAPSATLLPPDVGGLAGADGRLRPATDVGAHQDAVAAGRGAGGAARRPRHQARRHGRRGRVGLSRAGDARERRNPAPGRARRRARAGTARPSPPPSPRRCGSPTTPRRSTSCSSTPAHRSSRRPRATAPGWRSRAPQAHRPRRRAPTRTVRRGCVIARLTEARIRGRTPKRVPDQ